MVMYPVKSSTIVSIGYDQATMNMLIQFKNGLYSYMGIPEIVFKNFMAASSKGNYYANFIKGRFPAQRIDSIN